MSERHLPLVRDVLRLVLQLAVQSGSLKTNPVADVKAPKRRRQDMVFLSAAQSVAAVLGAALVRGVAV